MKLQRRKIEREANEATIALAWVVANAAGIEERANSDSADDDPHDPVRLAAQMFMESLELAYRKALLAQALFAELAEL